MHAETPRELVREVEEGESEKTPFLALGGVAFAVGIAVIVVVAIAFAAYYLA
jgi:hypothetical protein